MTENAVSFLNNCITAGMSLIVALGTWHVTMKKDREKQTEEVKTMLNNHREEYLTGIREVKDDVAKTNSHIGIIDEKISTLSDRVERHNNVIERTYHLETEVATAKERLSIVEGNVNRLRNN